MRHDWSYEYSDDGAVYRRGLVEREHLRHQQAAVDPTGAVWNSLCPAAYRLATQ